MGNFSCPFATCAFATCPNKPCASERHSFCEPLTTQCVLMKVPNKNIIENAFPAIISILLSLRNGNYGIYEKKERLPVIVKSSFVGEAATD